MEKLYRYEIEIDTIGFESMSSYKLQLLEVSVKRETEKSYICIDPYCVYKEKIIKKGKAKRKYAWETEDLAMKHLYHRTKSYIGHLRLKLNKATQGIELAAKELGIKYESENKKLFITDY